MPRVSPQPTDSRRRTGAGRRPGTIVFLCVLLFLAAGIAWPRSHGWQSLGAAHGRIRFVASRTDSAIEPPTAPDWIRDLRKRGIPWPTDLPLEPLGATFGAPSPDPRPVAWYMIQSAHPSKELWHVDKQSVRITDAAGKQVAWPGGSGSALVDEKLRLQYLYLGVPEGLPGTGAQMEFRLARFDDPSTTELVKLPF